MKSLLNKKRLPGILAVGLVSLAVGAAGAPASAAPVAATSGATVSALTKAQKKAKAKALAKCNKKRPAKKKKACKKAVNKKYNKIANRPTKPPIGKTVTVDLGDNYFAPDPVNLKVNDAINWSWANIGGYEPHNVTLDNGPAGVARNEFLSATSAVQSYRFKRQFVKAGTYNFVCSLHVGMTMTVNVSK